MMWLYHAFWLHALAGMMLMAYGMWSPEVMTKERIARLNSRKIPVWFWIIMVMLFAMVWLPVIAADLAIRSKRKA